MKKYYHAELAVYIRREKEIEKELEQLEKDFKTWKERVELAQKAGRPELKARAEQRIDDLRAEAWGLRTELKEIIEKKREIRMDSRRPSGVELQRAQSLLQSFRESGIIDPDKARLEDEIKEAAKQDDSALDALKVKAGMKEAQPEEPPPEEAPAQEPEKNLDAELAALRAKMGIDDGAAGDDPDDVDLEELERMFADDDDPEDDENTGE